MYRKIFCILLLIQVIWSRDSYASTFHVYPSGEKCLLEISRTELGRAFLVVSRLDSVYENRTYQPGSKLGKEVVVSFKQERAGEVGVFLPDYRIGEKETSSEMKKLVARDRVEMPLMTCPIQREDQEKLVIDITEMIMKGEPFFDVPGKRVVRFYEEDGLFACTVMRELPVVRRQWKRADDKLTEMPVTTTFFLLPETPGQGRERDRRIGFSSVSYDYFKDECTGIRTRHLIRRWALEPKDVAAYLTGKLTEPREPIVFYLDPMIPERWKPYFVQAVEDWQRAFEVAGFRNAIVTRDIPEETGQSLASLRGLILYQDSLRNEEVDVNVDPRSGQIIQARVHWAPEVLDSLKYEWVTRSALWQTGLDLKTVEEEIEGHLIRVTLGQRIGQALGLLPNKLASAWIPNEKLRDNEWLSMNGMSSSIMGDHVVNTVAQPEDRMATKNLFPVVGSYDCWAINWGYRYWGEEGGAVEGLQALLRRNLNKPEHTWYYSSDSPTAIEAMANLGTLGRNPVAGASCALANVKQVFRRADLIRNERDSTGWGIWVRRAGGKDGVLYSIVLPVLQQFGGIEICPQGESCIAKPCPVGREEQKEALAFLTREIFTTPQWLVQSPLIKKAGLAPSEVIAAWQNAVLGYLFEKGIVRFALNQVMSGTTSFYPLNEFLDDLYRAVWFESGKVDVYREALQMKYLECVEKALKRKPGRGESVALQVHLNRLYVAMEQALGMSLSRERKKSLVHCKSKIEDVIKNL